MKFDTKQIYNGKYIRLTTEDVQHLKIVLLNHINKHMNELDSYGATTQDNVKQKSELYNTVKNSLVVCDTIKLIEGELSVNEFLSKLSINVK